MKNRIIIMVMAVTLPLAAFLMVDQVYRYDHLAGEIEALQARQTELFEQNKRTVVNIAILKAPERIDRLAKELGLEKGRERSPLILSLPTGRRLSDG